MPPSFEETEDEDETQPPSQPSILVKVILLHYPSFYKYINVRFVMILLNDQT